MRDFLQEQNFGALFWSRKNLVEIMVEKITKVTLKRAEPVFHDGIHNVANGNKSCALNFRSEEPNILLDSQITFCKWKNVYWVIVWRDVVGRFGEVSVWKSRKINFLCTFWLIPSIRVPVQDLVSNILLSKDILKLGNCRPRHLQKS